MWRGARVIGARLRPRISAAPAAWRPPALPRRCSGEAAAATEGEGGAGDEETTKPRPPRVLWRARRLDVEFDASELAVNRSAFATAGGLGLALLGIAPHTAPNMFMVALLLSTLQVRFAHVWQIRQLRAQARRHVTEVREEIEEGEEDVKLIVHCDGGLSRTIVLGGLAADSASARPSLSEVLKFGRPFFCLDRTVGGAEDEEALAELLASPHVVSREELHVEVFEDESDKEAQRTVQRFANLTAEDLRRWEKAGADTSPSAKASMEQIARSAQMVAVVVTAGGVVICGGGRYADQSSSVASGSS